MEACIRRSLPLIRFARSTAKCLSSFPHSDRDKEPGNGQAGEGDHNRRKTLHKDGPYNANSRQVESVHHADRLAAVGQCKSNVAQSDKERAECQGPHQGQAAFAWAEGKPRSANSRNDTYEHSQ